MFIVIGYDEDWYIFENFKGVFSTKEKAQHFIDNDFETFDDVKVPNHEEYKIYEITIDKPFSEWYNKEKEEKGDN